MDDLNSLFEAASAVGETEEEISWLVIDHDFRTIAIPSNKRLLGVTSDERVNVLNFKAPRYYEGSDLSTFAIRVVYLNARGEGDLYLFDDVEAGENEMTFSWEVGRHACTYSGKVLFIISAVLTDSNGYILKKYNTQIHSLPVVEGLETETEVYLNNYDVITQFYENIQRAAQIDQYVSDAEAYSVGTRGGEPVGASDIAYQNNARYYAELMNSSADRIVESSYDAEAWAKGTRNGIPVDDSDEAYHNNAKYYLEETADVMATKADVFYDSVSGGRVAFRAPSAGVPLRSVAIDIQPVYDLKGYSKPWPADGGKNKLKISMQTYDSQVDGVTVAVTDDFRIVLNGTSTEIVYLPVCANLDTTAMAGKIFYVNAESGISWRIASADSTNSLQELSSGTEINDNGTNRRLLCRITNGTVLQNIALGAMIFDTAETDPAYEPNSNICPITAVASAEATRESESQTDSITTAFENVDPPYRSTFDIIKGTLQQKGTKVSVSKSDFGLITVSQNGLNYRQAALTGERSPSSGDDFTAAKTKQICNCAAIADPNTDTSAGQYVAVAYQSGSMSDPVLRISDALYTMLGSEDSVDIFYEIATPYTQQLEAKRLTTAQGQNYVWANCGAVTVEYPIDIKEYIDNKISELRTLIQGT